MKKVVFISIFLILLSFSIISNAVVTNSSEYNNVKVYVLYNEENEVYQQEKNWLNENENIRKEYINTNENSELLTKIKDALKIKKDDLPISVIGSTYFISFDEKVQNNIKEAIENYDKAEEYGDIVEKIKNNEDVSGIIKSNEKIYKQPNTSNEFLKIIFVIVAAFLIIFILKVVLKKNKGKGKRKR